MYAAANGGFALLAASSLAVGLLIYAGWLRAAGTFWPTFAAVVATGAFGALFTLQSAFVRLEERHRESVALGFLGPLAGFVGGALGFAEAHTVSSYFIGSALGFSAALAVFVARRVGFYALTLDARELQPILSQLPPYLCVAVFAWLSGYGNTYVVNSFFTSTDVARFTFTYTLSSIMQLVASSLNQAWSPRFYRLVRTQPVGAVELRYRHFTTLQGAALGAVGLCVLALLPSALRLFGGHLAAYQNLHFETFWLFSAYAASIPWWHVQNYYYAHSQGAALMYVTVVGSAAGFALWVVSMYALGTPGIYLGFFLQMALRSLTAVWVARRKWPLRIAWEGTVLAQLLLVAGTLAARTVSS